MRKFVKQEVIAVVQDNQDECLGYRMARSSAYTACTNKVQAQNLINWYVVKHDPFQRSPSIPLEQVVTYL